MKTAIVTLVDDNYLPGTLAMVHSARVVGFTGDVVAIVNGDLSQKNKEVLKCMGVEVRNFDYIKNPNRGKKDSHPLQNFFQQTNVYNKLHTWSLIDYKKVLFVDSDILFVRTFDHVWNITCDKGWIAACEIPAETSGFRQLPGRVNTGVFLISPDMETYKDLIDVKNLQSLDSYDHSDQGYICTYFYKKILFLSQDMNVSKRGSEWEIQNARAVHFLNQPKPWKCPEKVKVNDINPKLQSMWWRCYKQAVDKVCTRKQVAV